MSNTRNDKKPNTPSNLDDVDKLMQEFDQQYTSAMSTLLKMKGIFVETIELEKNKIAQTGEQSQPNSTSKLLDSKNTQDKSDASSTANRP